MPKVIVLIDDQGNIDADFMGFVGNECQHYEKRLRELLQGFGVHTQGTVQSKSAAQISQECQLENRVHGDRRWMTKITS